MENYRNKQFISLKLQALLSSVMKSLPDPICPTQEINHPFVWHIRPACIPHPPTSIGKNIQLSLSIHGVGSRTPIRYQNLMLKSLYLCLDFTSYIFIGFLLLCSWMRLVYNFLSWNPLVRFSVRIYLHNKCFQNFLFLEEFSVISSLILWYS